MLRCGSARSLGSTSTPSLCCDPGACDTSRDLCFSRKRHPLGCTVEPALSKPFSASNDRADYALAPGGDFATAAAGWALSRGAAVTSGNQPFAIGNGGRASLRLPAGSSATSAPMCVDSSHPHFRVFARNLGKARTQLKADVLFLNAEGDIRSTASGTVVAGNTAWSPPTR